MCAALALTTGQPMTALLELLHADYRLFDSMWYMAFPPGEDGGTPDCDIDGILGL